MLRSRGCVAKEKGRLLKMINSGNLGVRLMIDCVKRMVREVKE